MLHIHRLSTNSCHITTKPYESGVLCRNITESGVAMDHLNRQSKGYLSPLQTK